MTISRKKKIYFGIFWIILISSFIFFATLLIMMANGYHFNFKTLHLEKTGMLIIDGQINNVNINLNGQERTANLPAKFYQLFPGRYDLSVSKEGYSTWHKSFELKGGQAIIFDNLILFWTEPKVTNLGSDEKLIDRIKRDSSTQAEKCLIKNDEIWFEDKLITRFSQPILTAIYDSNNNQFYVQLQDELHTINNDGTNDNLLTKITTNDPIIMSVNSRTLQYLLDNSVIQVQMW